MGKKQLKNFKWQKRLSDILLKRKED